MGMNAQNIEVDDKFNYLGVMSESMWGWRKQKTPATAKRYQAIAAQMYNGKPQYSLKLHMENMYKMNFE